jgi:predicted phosphodiesterase
MFIDDSNWITTSAEDMTTMVANCETFVSFHGLKFNKSKCEYMALNQPVDIVMLGAKHPMQEAWTSPNANARHSV